MKRFYEKPKIEITEFSLNSDLLLNESVLEINKTNVGDDIFSGWGDDQIGGD